MANLRFPEDLDGNTDPWILFETHRAQYDRRNRSTAEVNQTKTGGSVGLYFPVGHTISDSFNYESFEEGLAGRGLQAILDRFPGGGRNTDETSSADIGDVAGGTGRSIVSALGGGIGGVSQRAFQRVTNPREFMLFNSPNIRDFSFSFRFVPHSFKEALDVPVIIQFFRLAAYPNEDGLEYEFPDVFNISYKQGGSGVIKLPELACTSINVTYNPNSISYFIDNGIPVEITLELSFTELRPISRRQVARGL